MNRTNSCYVQHIRGSTLSLPLLYILLTTCISIQILHACSHGFAPITKHFNSPTYNLLLHGFQQRNSCSWTLKLNKWFWPAYQGYMFVQKLLHGPLEMLSVYDCRLPKASPSVQESALWPQSRMLTNSHLWIVPAHMHLYGPPTNIIYEWQQRALALTQLAMVPAVTKCVEPLIASMHVYYNVPSPKMLRKKNFSSHWENGFYHLPLICHSRRGRQN